MSNLNYNNLYVDAVQECKKLRAMIDNGEGDTTIIEGMLKAKEEQVVELNRQAQFESVPSSMKGEGGTVSLWSDCYPVTVIEVSASGKQVKVQADGYRRTDDNGLSEDQRYDYYEVSTNPVEVFTKRSNGRFVRKGDDAKSGPRLSVGSRRAYRDPSF